MATIEMTITRALSELKTLQSRYVKSINGLNLVAVKQGSKLRGPNASYKENDFVNNAIEGLQSSDALYARIIAIICVTVFNFPQFDAAITFPPFSTATNL